jgi:hypothetical protein
MLLLNLILLIDVTFSTPTGDYAHPVKEDVKGKILSLPLAGNQGVVTYIQPCLLLRGAFDFSALDRRAFQRRCQPQWIVPR